MTMLMHTRGPFERAPDSLTAQDTAEAPPVKAHWAMFKRFCIVALTALAAGAALAAIIALKAAIFYWRFF
jgi:hypothetical protein